VYEEVLCLRPLGHERRAEAVGDLGMALALFCLYNEASEVRRARCFDLLREALRLCPPGHRSRDHALHSLAAALQFVGYEHQLGNADSLRECIMLNQAALQLRPAGHPERHNSLNNLACGFWRSFQQCGDLDLLAEAIAMHREALLLRPLGHPRHESSLHNLSGALETSFQHQGGMETLAEALSLDREALRLRPLGHPLRWGSLTGVGNALGISFAATGFPELLSESICLLREAVQLVPVTHTSYALTLTNLAQSLIVSFQHYHDRSALAEAITLLRQSLRLTTMESVHSDETLTELAEALIADFDENNHQDQLQEAVRLHRQALEHRPRGHYRRMESLKSLGRLLCRTECRSWSEALEMFHEALDICPIGSPIRAEVLSDTSRCFLDPESPFFDLSRGVAHLSDAYSDNFCHVNRRLRLSMSDLPMVERSHNEADTSLDASTLKRYSTLVLDLYTQVIGLLPRAANFGLDHSTRLQAVTGLDSMVRDAAARALLLGRKRQALEMLEEGRGVFWTQTLHLRTNALDDVPQEDRQELQRLLRLLEFGGRRVVSSTQNASDRERDLEKRRQLNEEAEALISKIRGYAGLGRFLLPPTFDALVGALPEGFVVVVNASKLGYHALLLNKNTGLVTSLELQPPPKGFDSATLRSQLPRDLGSTTHGGTSRAMRMTSGEGGSFLDVLAVLWTTIAQPVVTHFGLQVIFYFSHTGSH
jgi:tetratricopeptide (TPR) repeat protein